jgi:hypothetical protein
LAEEGRKVGKKEEKEREEEERLDEPVVGRIEILDVVVRVEDEGWGLAVWQRLRGGEKRDESSHRGSVGAVQSHPVHTSSNTSCQWMLSPSPKGTRSDVARDQPKRQLPLLSLPKRFPPNLSQPASIPPRPTRAAHSDPERQIHIVLLLELTHGFSDGGDLDGKGKCLKRDAVNGVGGGVRVGEEVGEEDPETGEVEGG